MARKRRETVQESEVSGTTYLKKWLRRAAMSADGVLRIAAECEIAAAASRLVTSRYRLLCLAFTFSGSVVTATTILDCSQRMILGTAFPSIGRVFFGGGRRGAGAGRRWAETRQRPHE